MLGKPFQGRQTGQIVGHLTQRRPGPGGGRSISCSQVPMVEEVQFPRHARGPEPRGAPLPPLPKAGGAGDGRHRRPALREGTGLIEDEVIDARQTLQHRPRLDQDAMTGAESRGDGNRHGGSHAEGAGTGDDEHSGGRHQGHFQVRTQPEEEGGQPQAQGDGDKPGHDPIGGALDGGLASLGLLHQGDDATQGRVAQQALDPDPQDAGTVEGAGRHPVPLGLEHGP